MRDYGKVAPRYWFGDTGKEIRRLGGPEALLVGAYLQTCASSNMIGLYYLPIITIAHETGLSVEGASKALARLSEGGFAHYDEREEMVWVPEMARHQIAPELKSGDKQILGVEREALKYQKSRFFADFVERYKVPFNLSLAKPLGRPIEGPSEPHQSQDQEQDLSEERETRARAPMPPAVPQWFVDAWKARAKVVAIGPGSLVAPLECVDDFARATGRGSPEAAETLLDAFDRVQAGWTGKTRWAAHLFVKHFEAIQREALNPAGAAPREYSNFQQPVKSRSAVETVRKVKP